MKKFKMVILVFAIILFYNNNYIAYSYAEVNKKPIVTFIDDDNKSEFLDIQKPIFDKYGIKSTLAIITDTVDSDGYLNLNQLKQLQKEGFEIVSHSKSHSKEIFKSSEFDLSYVKDDTIISEYKESSEWLKMNGFTGFDVIVYPWGDFGKNTDRYLKLSEEYYKYGVNATPYNKEYNHMNINRLFINKNENIDTYKKAINDIVENDGWLILGTHSKQEEINEEYLEEIIKYIKSKDIEVLTFKEAVNKKVNYVYKKNKPMSKKLIGSSVAIISCSAIALYLRKNKSNKLK